MKIINKCKCIGGILVNITEDEFKEFYEPKIKKVNKKIKSVARKLSKSMKTEL